MKKFVVCLVGLIAVANSYGMSYLIKKSIVANDLSDFKIYVRPWVAQECGDEILLSIIREDPRPQELDQFSPTNYSDVEIFWQKQGKIRAEMCDFLVKECGVDVNKAGKDNWTPLHDAVLFKPGNNCVVRVEILSHLLKLGADIHAKHNRGRTPVQGFLCSNESPATMGRCYDRVKQILEQAEQAKK